MSYGLPFEAKTQDHASIWRFRQTIERLGLSAVLFAETKRQLDALGLIVKRGTLVDATLIEAAVKRSRSGRAGDDDAEDGSFRLQGASGGGRRQRTCPAGRDDFGQCP